MSAGAPPAGPAYRHTQSGRLAAGLVASGVVALSVVVAAPVGAWVAAVPTRATPS